MERNRSRPLAGLKRRSFRVSGPGFTLLELVISSCLITLLSLAVFSAFARGLDVWKKVRTLDRREDSIRLELGKYARELRNVFDFTNVSFTGAADSISFATWIRSRKERADPVEQLGRVTYLFDPGKRTLLRKREGYGDLFHPDRTGFEEWIRGVDNAVFSYYAPNPGLKKYEWKETWKEKSRPAGVRLTLTVKDHETSRHIVQTVFFR
jgi:hypothetical protein